MAEARNPIVLYDMSRLINRRRADFATGIDRVDIRYANYFQANDIAETLFVCQVGQELRAVPEDLAKSLIGALWQKWIVRGAIPPNSFDAEFSKLGLLPTQSSRSDLVVNNNSFGLIGDDDIQLLFEQNFKERLAFVCQLDLGLYTPKGLGFFHHLPEWVKKATLAFVLSSELILKSYNRLAVGLSKLFRRATELAGAGKSISGDLAGILNALRPRMVLYINASHQGLTNKNLFVELRSKFNAHFIFFIHDLIPVDYPEYVRAGDDTVHQKRIASVMAVDPTIICNSDYTRSRLSDFCRRQSLGAPRATVRHIGVEASFLGAKQQRRARLTDRPYFVALGTIEPRKNHLLLLNVWRRLAEMGQAEMPLLYIIGKRGWENENIVDLLDRSSALRPHVIELSTAQDELLAAILSDARALLMPSHAEGWGMPIVEALSLGVPVLCSDIPVFHEAGQDVPDYLDNLDGPGWSAAILDYADMDSSRRQEQLRRIEGFNPPTWEGHMASFAAMMQDA